MNKEEINKIIDNLDGCIGMFNYLITPIESNLLVSYIKELQQENQELKKLLEEYRRLGFKYLNDKCNKLENQQKEFINYINAYIELLKYKPDLVEEVQKDILEEILSKYREIIGGKDEIIKK